MHGLLPRHKSRTSTLGTETVSWRPYLELEGIVKDRSPRKTDAKIEGLRTLEDEKKSAVNCKETTVMV